MRRLIFRMLASCRFLLSWLHVLRLVVLLLSCHRSLLVVRVLIFFMIIVVEIDMWRIFATGRRKLRRPRLAILHKVLVVLILENLRGVLMVQRHGSYSCYFIVLRPLRRQELLVL
jgi:hypothetical protein